MSISALGLIAVAGAAGAVVVSGDATPEPVRRVEVEWEQPAGTVPLTVPLVDVVELADIHADSRLEFDECRSDYAATGNDRTVGRNPLYFC